MGVRHVRWERGHGSTRAASIAHGGCCECRCIAAIDRIGEHGEQADCGAVFDQSTPVGSASNGGSFIATTTFQTQSSPNALVRINGVTAASGDAGAAPGTKGADGPLTLGSTCNGLGPYYGGSVAEVIVCRAGLADDQIATVERYLAQKWGLTLG